ncbi:type VI secretion system-associated FHA domain protein TagH [Variovorax sp.]|uniref:type VI secretion system-associated FHA domain protein TagH n=1 Tax=Variovorax sp. TaxID=1871043 RepID=UPI002D6BBA54|nr:type VI secretion system-associated FHA domain protein TagH [Variovorax sp.]HYP84235.1 type VI secretion system-associated FHA domain protein TagH [Variovorax sp.]
MIRISVRSHQGAPVARPPAAQFGPQGGTIGRAAHNTLVLDDPDRTVSRVHAQVQYRDGRHFIVDRGSNALSCDGRPLGAGNEAELQPGMQLLIGGFELGVESLATVTGVDDPAAAPARPRDDDPFADLLAGLDGGSAAPTPTPTPATAKPADDGLFPDPMATPSGGGRAQRAAAAPSSADDPFADLLGSDTAAPQPGAIEDFSDLGLRAPDAAAGIDHLFGGAPRPGEDPLALSPLADPLRRPNTAGNKDPLAALAGGPARAAPAPKADHLPVERFGFDVPRAVVPAAPSADAPFADLLPAAPVSAPAVAPVAAPAAPVAAREAVPAPAAGGAVDDAALLAALVRGLASTHQMPQRLTPELMERIGVLLRTATEGTLQMLLARQEVKKGVHAEVTMIAAQANNPLKFSPTAEVALGHLLGPGMRGFMGAEEAMRDAYDDLRAHEFGVMVGMRAALAHVLARFTPEELEKKIAARSALDSLFTANRKARLWDQFVALYGAIASEAEDDFHSLFGKAFVQAYEEQMKRLKSGGG